ncbi:MAG: beta-glucosidase [Saprospiraceae bacterium]|nr:MAG: beta-glucosidase [Saprospiraceae bacterium]
MKNFKIHILTLIVLSLAAGMMAFQPPQEGKASYLNPLQPIENRVKDLMSRMTLEEKVAQMCQYVGLEHMKIAEKDLTEEEMKKSDAQGFYPGLYSKDVAKMVTEGRIGSFLHVVTAEEANHLQKLAMQSRLKIPLLIGIDAIHGNGLYHGATIYPSPITMAASWDDTLMYKASRQTALEMRASGTHWAFTPNIDVLRDPRWGRSGETFGEDPFLVGNMGIATIKGLQTDDFTGEDKVIACAKHLIAGSQSINGLNAAPTDVSERTLLEVYLPPYRRAIKEAKVFTIMAAHNEVNGIPCHMDKHLMTDLLRDQWGFPGFYVSDWNDVSRIATLHHAAKDFKEASLLSVSAGLDMHMHGPQFQEYIVELVQTGALDLGRIEEACAKILEAKFRLGLFENPIVDLENVEAQIFTPAHQATALEAARKAITLLKNNGILPLEGGNKSIFVTGPNANNQTTLGDWASPQPEDRVTTVYEGIEALGKSKGYKVSYYDVGEHSKLLKEKDIQQASQLAKAADITILVLGENSFRHDWKNKTTGENIDRATLQLSGKQLQLAKAIHAIGKPIIVVYVNGSPIAEPWLAQNTAAIVETWEPGSFGGQAAAEVLFGEVNPSGKLPVTVPRSVGQLQMVYNHKPSTYKHKYHTEKKTPLYPFGYGLSFTTYGFSVPELSSSSMDGDVPVSVSVNVTNTGKRSGEEIVQFYIRDKVSSATRPVKELKGYQRVYLKSGETKTVTFNITPELLAFYDIDMNYVVEPGDFLIMTGPSSADKDLKQTTLTVSEKIKINL